ncbi:MAG: hypothetical protein WC145_06475 [Aliarcobacter sp.]
MRLTTDQVRRLDHAGPAERHARLGHVIQQLQSLEVLPLFLPGTLGHDAGPGSDGVLIGALTDQAVGHALAEDGTEITDETAAANNATTNDMTLWPSTPEEDDAYYIGASAKFCGVVINFTTAASNLVMTTALEYWDGEDWVALAAEDNTAGLMSTATGSKLCSFVPPADWRVTTITDKDEADHEGYFVRWRCTEYTSKTAVPKAGQAWVLDLTHGAGLYMPGNCSIAGADFTAATLSATNGDTVFLVINLTKGTCAALTYTKALAIDHDVLAVPLKFAAGDQLVIKQVMEDGSTEYANVNAVLKLEV